MLIQVVNAKYISDFKLELEFDGGFHRVVNFQTELDGEVFEPLKNIEFFKDFYINCGTVSWKNGADFAPEYLFLISKPLPARDSLSELEKDTMTSVQKLYGVAS